MGQKINPIGLRLGINRSGIPLVRGKNEYGKLLHEDVKIREILHRSSKGAVARIVIERPTRSAVTIHSRVPGRDRKRARYRQAAQAGCRYHRIRVVSTSSKSASPNSTPRWSPMIAQQLEPCRVPRAMKRACSRRCVLAPRAFVSTARPPRRAEMRDGV